MDNQALFSGLVTQFRKRMGLTKSELAKRVGVSLPTIIRYETPSNQGKKPSLKTVARLCQVLELDTNEQNLVFKTVVFKNEDIHEVESMIKSLMTPMFADNIVSILTKPDMLATLELLSKMDDSGLDQALKVILSVASGLQKK